MGVVSGLIMAGTALSGAASYAQGRGLRRAANDAVNEGNRLAQDAITRGEEQVRRYGFDLSRLLGRQRTVAAAQGIDPTVGSAALLRSQTETFGAEDVATIRENAMREAFGLRRQGQAMAANLRSQATGAYLNAFGSALSLGQQGWDVYQNRTAGTMMRRTTASTMFSSDSATWG